MQEGVIIKIPAGSEPLEIRQGWLFLRFVFEFLPDGDALDAITGTLLPFAPYCVPEAEAYRIMDNQRPGMADFYRQNTNSQLQGLAFSFAEDEIHFLKGTEAAWG